MLVLVDLAFTGDGSEDAPIVGLRTGARTALRPHPRQPTDCSGSIVLKNTADPKFWREACMPFVIDGGAHHDGASSIAGSALLRVQPR